MDLVLEQLQFGYKKPIYNTPLQLTFSKGQCIALLGRNGCGKTTLLRTIARLNSILSGNIRWKNQNIQQYSAKSWAKILSLVNTELHRVAYLTIQDLVGMGRFPHQRFHIKTPKEEVLKIEQTLALVGITELAQLSIQHCSDGQLQLALIARALAQDTPIILLDEPTAHLDFVNSALIFRTLQQLAHQENKLIIIATHDLNWAVRYSDYICSFHTNEIQFAPTQDWKESTQAKAWLAGLEE